MFLRKFPVAILAILGVALSVDSARGGTATAITGLYTTGQESHVENWWMTVDNHWVSSNSEGNAYVIGATPGGWASSTSAKWISASAVGYPGTSTTYSYALTFNISGTGTGNATNAAITLTLYVDDSATIYVNGVQKTVVSGSNLYTNPTTVTLNSNFIIGNNTISRQQHRRCQRPHDLVDHGCGARGGCLDSAGRGFRPFYLV